VSTPNKIEGEFSSRTIDLRRTAAATAVAIGTVALAALAYRLIDVFLLLFIGMAVAAALQPSHVKLCRWGVPKGLAVLLIYLLFSIGLVSIALLVGPALIEQIRTTAAALPETYATLRSRLLTSAPGPFQLIGHRLPTFERSTDALIAELSRGVVGITTSVVHLFAYFVTVLAVAFYWTMEVPRFERLTLSLLSVGRRAHVLNVWHEIESKLGAYLRAQGLAMLSIGVASAIGYTLIGLPNALALGFLAGLLEAVPLIGPTLASGPAVIVALPLGLRTVLLVIGFSVVVQVTENNVLIPRIMHRAVGVSALVGIFAVLAFGTLYGLLGVFIAIPMTAVIQVLLESMVVDTDPAAAEDAALNPWAGLRARIRALRQQGRIRLRARGSRMGIDPATADHVADAVDQQIEKAGVQVERIISAAEETSEPLAAKERAAIVGKLEDATVDVEQAVERVETVIAANADSEAPLDDLERAAQHFEDAVHDASTNGACQESPFLRRREESAGSSLAASSPMGSSSAVPRRP
jgi:predicted PurR-regulated permease PerM